MFRSSALALAVLIALSCSLLALAPAKSRYAPMPYKASSLGACVEGDFIYIYGGHTGKMHAYSNETTVGKFYRAKVTGGEWEELTAGPAAQGLNLIAHKGKIIRVGGMQPRNKPGEKGDSHSLTETAAYDPASKKWSLLPALPEGRSSHDLVLLGDTLYVVGGWNMQGSKGPAWAETMLSLNLADKDAKWQSIKQPFQRRALSALAVDNKIVVYGGLTIKDGATGQVDIYDPKQDKWSTGVELPDGGKNGFSAAACLVKGKVILSGANGKVYRLDGESWKEIGKLAVKRMVHRIVPGPDGKILVLGGASREEEAKNVEEIDVP
jgi:hypothetical protein